MTEFADLEMSEVQKTWSFIMVHKLSYNISVTLIDSDPLKMQSRNSGKSMPL